MLPEKLEIIPAVITGSPVSVFITFASFLPPFPPVNFFLSHVRGSCKHDVPFSLNTSIYIS